MVKFEHIVDPNTGDKSIQYQQKWSHEGTVTESIEPGIVAPTSTVLFWSHRLGIHEASKPEYFDHHGYCSRRHLESEMRGLYTFYKQCRY